MKLIPNKKSEAMCYGTENQKLKENSEQSAYVKAIRWFLFSTKFADKGIACLSITHLMKNYIHILMN